MAKKKIETPAAILPKTDDEKREEDIKNDVESRMSDEEREGYFWKVKMEGQNPTNPNTVDRGYVGKLDKCDDIEQGLCDFFLPKFGQGVYYLECYDRMGKRLKKIETKRIQIGIPRAPVLGHSISRAISTESDQKSLKTVSKGSVDEEVPSIKRKQVAIEEKKLEIDNIVLDKKLERVQGGDMDGKYLEMKMENMQRDMNNAILQLGSAMKDAIKDIAAQKPQEESKLIPLMMDSNNKMFMMMMENNKQSMMLMLENMKQSGESSKQASDRNLEIMLKMMSDKGNPKDNTFSLIEKTMDILDRREERSSRFNPNPNQTDIMTPPAPWYQQLIETVMGGLKEIIQSGGLQKLIESGVLQKAITSRVSQQEPSMSADDITLMAASIKDDIINKIRRGEIKIDGLLLNPPEPAVIPNPVVTPATATPVINSSTPATTGAAVAVVDPEELKKQIVNAILPVMLAEAELRPNESQWVQQAYDYLPAEMLEAIVKAEKVEDLQPVLLKYVDLNMLLALQEKLKDEKIMKWFMACVDRLKEMVAEKKESEEIVQSPENQNSNEPKKIE